MIFAEGTPLGEPMSAGSAGRMTALQLERVTKTHPGEPPVVALDDVSLTLGAGERAAAVGVGMLAGCYPALRAARLAPADALRAI